MRRLLVISLVVFIAVACYALVYAEESNRGGDNLKILPNMDFESVVEMPDISKTTPVEGFDTALGITAPDTTFFPFGWQKFINEEGDISSVVITSGTTSRNGLLVASNNPQATYTTLAFDTFPSPETLNALAGRKIRLSAKVCALIATEAGTSTDVREMEQDTDFTAEKEMMEHINFAGVNILFFKHTTKDKDRIILGKTIKAPQKTRTVAFSTTTGFIELYCDVTVPSGCDTAALILETKGVAKAVFTDVAIDVVEDRASKIVLPLNLDMNTVICSSAGQPRDWYVLSGGSKALAFQTDEQAKSGKYSLEIHNPDPLNNSENIIFASNFDVTANRSLWGHEVKLSCAVKTDMVPGITPDSYFLDGERTLEAGKDYKSAADLVAYRNYASASIVCRNELGKILVPTMEVRKFVFGKTAVWTNVETVIVVPPRTYSIEWELMIVGRGRAWFDDALVETGTSFALDNPGFEKRYEPPPSDWEKDSVSATALVITDTENVCTNFGQDSKRSLCLINPRNIELNASFFIETDIPCGYKLIFEADVLTDFDRNNFQQNAYIQMQALTEESVENAAYNGWPISSRLSGKSGWKRLKAVLVVDDLVYSDDPESGIGINFVLHMKGVGKVYFDNISLKTTRLAFPSTSLLNGGFNGEGTTFDGWEITGAAPDSVTEILDFEGAYAYGIVKKDGARIYQNLLKEQEKAADREHKGAGALLIGKYIGKPIVFEAKLKCEMPASAIIGFDFLGADDKTVLSTVEADSPLAGVERKYFIYSPFVSVSVSTIIPADCRRIRAFLRFTKSGDEHARFHILEFAISGGAPEPTDSISFMEGSISEFLGKYGIEDEDTSTFPPAALANGSFAATDARKPVSYEGFGLFRGIRFYTISAIEEMKNYRAFEVGTDTLRIAQAISFPTDIHNSIGGRKFTFFVEGFTVNGASGNIGIEFRDKAGNAVGETVTTSLASLSSGDFEGMKFFRARKSTVTAKIPAGAETAVVSISSFGEGNLLLSKAGMDYIYVASGFLDWLAYTMIFDFAKLNVLVGILVLGFLMIYFIFAARHRDMFVRKIPGLDSVDEAVGRATEMGKPILFVPGLDSIDVLATIAALNILGRVAKKVAEYDTPIIVPNWDPLVMTVAQETVKSAFLDAGRPDSYRDDSVFFVTDEQFAYASAVSGTMVREKPAANFFMGGFYAESLIFAETGAMTGAIQVAGTDSVHQLPFFIVACDYTLMGEELYAASAYLSREPMQMGSLKGSDYAKVVFMTIIILGSLIASLNWASLRWILDLMNVQ